MVEFQLSLEFDSFVMLFFEELRITGRGGKVVLTAGATDCELALDLEATRRLHDEIVSDLRTYDQDGSWTDTGLDGTEIRGTFESPGLSVPEFAFWSPRPGTPAHSLLSAVVGLLPPDFADDRVKSALESIKAGRA